MPLATIGRAEPASSPPAGRTDASYIAEALTIESAFLFVGMAGFVLHLGPGLNTLTGTDVEDLFGEALAKGLPIIDVRLIPEPEQIRLAHELPMPAVGCTPTPPPYGPLSRAPLEILAAVYAAAGARLANLPDIFGSYGGLQDYARLSAERAKNYAEDVRVALQSEGGHLWIGNYGGLLHYGAGCRRSGFDVEAMRIAAIEAGLPVIDLRGMEPAAAARAVQTIPNVAVGGAADPKPWTALSFAPLADVADQYRRAGAAVFNVDPLQES